MTDNALPFNSNSFLFTIYSWVQCSQFFCPVRNAIVDGFQFISLLFLGKNRFKRIKSYFKLELFSILICIFKLLASFFWRQNHFSIFPRFLICGSAFFWWIDSQCENAKTNKNVLSLNCRLLDLCLLKWWKLMPSGPIHLRYYTASFAVIHVLCIHYLNKKSVRH